MKKNILILLTITTLSLQAFAEQKTQEKNNNSLLSLDTFIKTSIRNNPVIKKIKNDYEKQRNIAKKAKAIKDLFLYTKTAYSHNFDDSRTSTTNTSQLGFQTSLTKTFPSLLGMTASLNLDYGLLKGNSSSAVSQYSTKPSLGLSITIPLLNNFLGMIDRNTLKTMKYSIEILNNAEKEILENYLLDLNTIYLDWILATKKATLYKGFMKRALQLFQQTLRKQRFGIADNADRYLSEQSYLSYKIEYNKYELERHSKYLQIKSSMSGKNLQRLADSITNINNTTLKPAKLKNQTHKLNLDKINLNNLRNIKIAKLNLASAGLTFQSANNEKKPELNFILNYNKGTSSVPSTFSFNNFSQDDVYAGLELSFSFQNSEKKYDSKASKYELKRLKKEFEELQINTIFSIKESIKTLQESEKILSINKKKSNITRLRVNYVYNKYLQGKITLQQYIDSIDDSIKAQINYEEQKISYQKSILQYVSVTDRLYKSKIFN